MIAVAFMLQFQNISKAFGDVRAVSGVTLSIKDGICFGFLGPNGAGKTTLMKMLYGVCVPSSGEILLNGKEVFPTQASFKNTIGVVFQENNLDTDFTCYENLLMFARYFSIPKTQAKKTAAELLAFVHLEDKKNVPVEHLSGGMKRRLMIARALVHRPEILILDEPTTGLDPQGRHLVWQKLRELKEKGVTLLLTTQHMEEAAELCDELVIMDEGKCIAQGAPSALIEKYVGGKKDATLEDLFLHLTGRELKE